MKKNCIHAMYYCMLSQIKWYDVLKKQRHGYNDKIPNDK